MAIFNSEKVKGLRIPFLEIIIIIKLNTVNIYQSHHCRYMCGTPSVIQVRATVSLCGLHVINKMRHVQIILTQSGASLEESHILGVQGKRVVDLSEVTDVAEPPW